VPGTHFTNFFLSKGPFLTLPRGRICPPGVTFVPWGVKFSVCPSILIYSREGMNKRANISPRGQISPLGARGEVKNGSLGCKIFFGTTFQNGKNIPNDHGR
jgi:hypothetical protein